MKKTGEHTRRTSATRRKNGSSATRPTRKLLIDGLLVSTLALFLLLAGEATVRVVKRAQGGGWEATRASRFYGEITTALGLYRKHPYLNVAPREGARVEAFGRQASFNSLGYRSPVRPRTKPEGVIRVLCVGGSTTFDILAANDQASWPWLLERILVEGGHPVEVWNAGFPGWTSQENLISLAIRDRDLQPDWIVVFQGINDLQPASHVPFDRQYENGHADIAHRTLGFDLEPLAWHQRSLLLEFLRDALGDQTNPWDRVRPASPNQPIQSVVPPAAVAVFERNLRSIIALGRQHEARILIVPQSIRLRVEYLADDRSLLAQWIPGLAPEVAVAELEKLNLAGESLAVPGWVLHVAPPYQAWDDADWDDAMHFSADGSRRLARLLAEALAPRLVEP